MKFSITVILNGIILLLSPLAEVRSQEPAKPTPQAAVNAQSTEDKIEELSGRTDAELDFSDLIDEKNQFLNHPVNINSASESELYQLQLNDIQIRNLKNYILQYGELGSYYELNLVEGFDSLLVTSLSPYISFELSSPFNKVNFKNLIATGKNQLILRFQQVPELQQGYRPIGDSAHDADPDSRYLGGPQKLLLRYGYNFYNKIRFGVTMEKDAGETLFPDSDSLKKGFDFYSLFFYYSGKKFVRHLAIGDYQVQFGQGLTLHSSLAFGKSPDAIANRRMPQPVKPSTGANENLFMRGIAATISPLKNTDLTLFFSSKQSDAIINDADSILSDENYITSLRETGYHRTPGELSGKDAVKQTVFGGNIQTRFRMFRIGFTSLQTVLGDQLLKKSTLYNSVDFSGRKLINFGIDYAMIVKGITLYGEFSGSNNGGKAMLTGLTYTPDPRMALALIYRNYSPNYQNFFSNAFSEGSRNTNEKGIYAGILTQLHKRISFFAYADHFRFPWLKYRIDAPSAGCEYVAQLTWTPSRKTDLLFRYRFLQKQMNATVAGGITDYPETESHQNYRLHLNFRAMESLTLKTRIETIKWLKPGSGKRTGFLVYQDIIFSPPAHPWQISTRYALFDTDSYDQRLYAYESDVLYSFSVPAYYYKGSRFYLSGKYSFGRRLDVWIRYSITYYTDRQSIGSGLEEIRGNKKSEIKIQMRVRF